MKKFASLLMTAVLLATMLCVFAVPASAEEEPTEIEPDGGVINIDIAGNYIIRGEYVVINLEVVESDVTLTIAKGATVTVENSFNNFGTINVCGTLNLTDAREKPNAGTIRIMGCIGGKIEGTVNNMPFTDIMFGTITGTVTTYDVHNFENGKCACGTYECMGVAKHNWVNGVCSACNVKGCEIGQLKHNWVNGVCSVCDKHCDHEWDAATGKCTVCEYVCPHDGNTCVECGANIHGGEVVQNLGLGSVLSEGSLTLIIGIAALVIGLGGGFLLGKIKKKPALASGENTDEE